ncbi:hypothetical protein SARC_02514 [Sphaeroforma arctica JP610]|uniref:Uncharacterized protein n=1 Tax=Sphaeroforma arctica JP610 TaxID=667725 RepID=A0A0L0G8T4_9EUKA|nr:hypothetical protein SARC_02514 [Sphaeroforma arctica JP610]KNC85291.1 hypothetical protein SARC_02514 [Sphaeroforma arctica JP610]|eukprot:XP_014159193.1 hypothetical protein SARC_02514 [Sphaeroforma arctica JP610]
MMATLFYPARAVERLINVVRIIFGTFILPYLTVFLPWDNTFRKDRSTHFIFITGCDSGFGYMLSKSMDKKGFSVIATCLTDKGAQKLKSETSDRLRTMVFDMTNEKQLDEAVENTKAICGNYGLYCLVNNAGVADEAPFEFQDMAAFRRVMEINYFAMVAATKGLMPLLRKSGQSSSGARVINVASCAGRSSAPAMAAYTSSKFAVEAFSDSLRREFWSFNVHVSVVEPGFMRTPIATTVDPKGMIARKWDKASSEVQNAYGYKFFTKILENPKRLQAILQDPQMTIVQMEKNILKAYPKSRYSAGYDSIFYVASSYMPAFVIDVMCGPFLPRPDEAKFGKYM